MVSERIRRVWAACRSHPVAERVGMVIELGLQMIYPPACVSCDATLFGHRAPLCGPCGEQIAWITEGACHFCGAPAGPHATLDDCEECRNRNLRFTRAVAVARYAEPTRSLIHAFKYHGARRLAVPLAERMVERLRVAELDRLVDAVLPVPLHRRRLRERGYNQAALLAKVMARKLERPFLRRGLERTCSRAPQAQLSGDERRALPGDAFRVLDEKALPPRVLLIDDVLTTGSTVSACAQALRGAGVQRVYVAVFAR